MPPAQRRKRLSNSERELLPAKGLGSAIARQRRKAQKELEASANSRRYREINGARVAIENAKKRARAIDPAVMYAKAVMASVADAQTAVLRSYGLRLPVTTSVDFYNSNVVAYTDFDSVFVKYPFRMFAQRDDSEGVLRTIATLKGVFQHEFGHCRFTTPMPNLVDIAYPEMERSTRDHFLQTHLKSWNLLEDQRMENLVVDDVPRIANYFMPMVFDIVLQHSDSNPAAPWLFTAGRRYIDPAIRRAARQQFVTQHGDDNADKWLDIVNAYLSADNGADMVSAVIDATEFLNEIMVNLPQNPGGGNGHGQYQRRDEKNEDSEKRISETSSDDDESDDDESDDEDSDDGQGGGSAESDDDADDAGQGGDGESDDDGEGDEAGSGGSDTDNDGTGDGDDSNRKGDKGNTEGESEQDAKSNDSKSVTTNSGQTDPTFSDLADEMQRQADEALNRAMNDFDVRDMAKDAAARSEVAGIPDAPWSGSPLPDDLVLQCESQASFIAQSLNDFLTTSQPAWVSHTESGVLDALAYRTKAVGALDYHRSLHGDVNAGLNVHVSMLADVSASMGDKAMRDLSVAMYSMARACRMVGIGSTFTLWSEADSTYRIWRTGEEQPLLWPNVSGTDPHMALDDLANHNPEGAEHHLVVVFTDGAWAGDFPGLQNWSTPNRHFVLVVHSPYAVYGNTDNRGADEAFTIRDITDMPAKFGVALKDILSRKSL